RHAPPASAVHGEYVEARLEVGELVLLSPGARDGDPRPVWRKRRPPVSGDARRCRYLVLPISADAYAEDAGGVRRGAVEDDGGRVRSHARRAVQRIDGGRRGMRDPADMRAVR